MIDHHRRRPRRPDFPESDSASVSISASVRTLQGEIDNHGHQQQAGQYRPPNVTSPRNRWSCLRRTRKVKVEDTDSWSIVDLYEIIRRHPHTVVFGFILFVILLTASLTLCVHVYNAEMKALEEEAMASAEETGLFFSDQFRQALLPLFSLAQFVSEIQAFRDMEYDVGFTGEPNSLPLTSETHRNVTGVCDDPTLVARFSKIASTVKSNSGMDGVLVNLQLAPAAVVCLLYPLNNTEDFPDGVFMDNTGAVGHDLWVDPTRKVAAETALSTDEIVVNGPLSLRQCDGCHPTVEHAFIARLSVPSFMTDEERREIMGNDTTSTTNGLRYKKWGFVVALINWNALIEKSGLYDTFEDGKYEFRLTQTDPTDGNETIILAESSNFNTTAESHHVRIGLQATHSEWCEITVAYSEEFLGWFRGGIAAAVFFSLFISILVCTIFIQNQRHSDEKHRLMVETANKAARNERDINEFVAHEVRNPISAALSACSFVSASLDEAMSLMGAETGATLREDVSVIESSLKYADDLLHTMLDLNRIDDTEMHLRAVPTDIKYHILHPVASMIQRRENGAAFEVIVECQDGLVVSIDRLRLKQIVFNLARSSTKFVTAGGFIRLRARPMSTIDFDGTSDGKSGICLYVEDSSPGISDKNCGSMAFAAYNDSQLELNQGTGIGFSICKKLVELMDGKIELDRSYNSGIPGMPGIRFSISLLCDFAHIDMDTATKMDDSWIVPAASNLVRKLEDPVTSNKEETPKVMVVDHSRSHQERNIPSTMSSSTDQSASRVSHLPQHFAVLFVDDDKILRKLCTRSLRRIRPEWSIHEAESGEAALELVDKDEMKSFDLIFIDHYMASQGKRLLGTETVAQMRRRGVESIICGLSANDLRDAFVEAGADAFLMKPFPSKPDELIVTMLELLKCRPTANAVVGIP